MKYLFINSVAGVGSTGRIAADQCRKLEKEGHQCVLAYGRAKANCDDIQTIQIGTPWDYRWHGVITRVFDKHGFGSKRATKDFLRWVEKYNPDVIWLHNIHGYYINIELLFEYLKNCNKKVNWTLHDCWAITGHCSHFDYIGCNRWKTECYNCPQKGEYPKSRFLDNSKQNFKRKREAFVGVRNLKLIVPSEWLKKLIEKSFLKEYSIEVVYNTVDLSVFKPTESNFRERYNLGNKQIVLGVANIWNRRKGFEDFLKLSNGLDDDWRIILVGLNEKQMSMLPENVIGIKRTNSAVELAETYTAADVFLNLTYEDNYPTVNLEAQACGTKVISYDTGGAKETLWMRGSRLIQQGDLNTVRKIIGLERYEKKAE